MVDSMRRRLPCRLAAVGTVAIAAFVPAVGQASTITIGSTQTAGVEGTTFGSPGSATVTNLSLVAPGMTATSPVDGVILRWRTTEASGGPFYLRVLRPGPPGQFLGAGTSAAAAPAGPGTQTYTTTLPIQRGDLIGLNTTNPTDKVGAFLRPGSILGAWTPALADGASLPPKASVAGAEFVFSADVQPAPAVTAISPSSGSISGGTNLTIAGTDLTGATSVQFGETPAAISPGGSDTQITAIVPKVKKPGPVSISVLTNAGRSPASAGGSFTYTACVVPKLKGKTVKAARKRLKKAGCKLGKVKGEGKRVTGQGTKKGKNLPVGKKVNVKLG